MVAEREIETALGAYADAWRLNSAAALVAHWSQADFAYYKAEEIRSFYTAWDDVLAYWAQNEGLHDDIRLQLSNLKHIALGPERRMVAMDMNSGHTALSADAKLANGMPFHHRSKAIGWPTIMCWPCWCATRGRGSWRDGARRRMPRSPI